MPIIHLIGPNAIGKTTAVRRWAGRYANLTTASLDLLRKEAPDGPAKRQYLETKAGDAVVVAESVYSSQVLRVVSCDQGGAGARLEGGEWVADPDWKGDQAEKERKVLALRRSAPIALVESARTTTTTVFALPDEPVIVVICPGAKLRDHLKARCEAKGKKFRDDYWTEWKCDYEAQRRYLNFAAKNLRPEQYRVFTIEDQARDWPAVDDYFGTLYRRLHNDLVRRRRAVARGEGVGP